MTRIAHLSDLHVLEDDPSRNRFSERFRLRFLSAGRPIDAAGRRDRLCRALRRVVQESADHLVITGDLTEEGTPRQFEALAAQLLDCGIPPEAVTLIPGNHDAYTDRHAWSRALAGPLRPFAPTSHPGAITELADAVIVAVSATLTQHYTRSAGALRPAQARHVERLASDPSLRGKALLVAVHHPPMRRTLPIVHWWDGLQGWHHLAGVLARHEHCHVLHGHVHRRWDRTVAGRQAPQVFAAEAVVEHDHPLRLYDASMGRLLPIESASSALVLTPRADAVPSPLY